jgi:hypothetical protein
MSQGVKLHPPVFWVINTVADAVAATMRGNPMMTMLCLLRRVTCLQLCSIA